MNKQNVRTVPIHTFYFWADMLDDGGINVIGQN